MKYSSILIFLYVVIYIQLKDLINLYVMKSMSKKIDFLNKNKKMNSNNGTKSMVRANSGSKTPKNLKIAPKRRGRRPKKIIDNDDTNILNSEEPSNQENNSAIILKLNIDPSKLKGIKNMGPIKKDKEKEKKTITNKKKINNNKSIVSQETNDIYDEDDSSEGMFKNDIPNDNLCNKCEKTEKTINLLKSKLEKYEKKEKLDNSNKIYTNKINFISILSNKKFAIKKTNTLCWWDSHNFSNLPFPLPESFHNNTYYITGCFCSVNCALAYNLYYLKDSKIHHRKSLIYKLYREMYGLTSDDTVDIKEAPPKEILEAFGGEMSIDSFRRTFISINKEYIVYVPPVRPVNITIEERNIEIFNDSDKKYVLKRSKPLAKKRSIMSSMNIHANDD